MHQNPLQGFVLKADRDNQSDLRKQERPVDGVTLENYPHYRLGPVTIIIRIVIQVVLYFEVLVEKIVEFQSVHYEDEKSHC